MAGKPAITEQGSCGRWLGLWRRFGSLYGCELLQSRVTAMAHNGMNIETVFPWTPRSHKVGVVAQVSEAGGPALHSNRANSWDNSKLLNATLSVGTGVSSSKITLETPRPQSNHKRKGFKSYLAAAEMSLGAAPRVSPFGDNWKCICLLQVDLLGNSAHVDSL